MATATPERTRRPPKLLVPPGVYRPQADTRLLERALCRERIGPGTAVLDLGTGCGALALKAAEFGARVTAVDIARRAVWTTRINALLAGRRLNVLRGDLTAAVRPRTYDLVISNPPYVPAPAGLPRRGAARAWDAGHDGRHLVDRICDSAPGVLRPDGALLMVHSTLCGVGATVRRLTAAGLRAEIVDWASVPLGPVLRSRRGWLEDRGLLESGRDEELVVIRAEPH